MLTHFFSLFPMFCSAGKKHIILYGFDPCSFLDAEHGGPFFSFSFFFSQYGWERVIRSVVR